MVQVAENKRNRISLMKPQGSLAVFQQDNILDVIGHPVTQNQDENKSIIFSKKTRFMT